MDLGISLILYVVVVILTFLLARSAGIRVWSAIILALIVGQIILALIKPFGTIEGFLTGNTLSSLYVLIMAITPILVIIYVFTKALTDREFVDVGRAPYLYYD